MAAAASGSAKVLRAILNKKNIADELMMPIRQHALHEAAKNGHLEVIQVLAAFGAHFDQATDKIYSTGNTPIHVAALAGKDNVIQVLASRGCNALLKNKENKTARAVAKELGHKAVVKACKKAEKFTKAKTKPDPWLVRLHDFCYVHDQELLEAFSVHDKQASGLIASSVFLQTIREFGVPEPDDPSAWEAVLANHTVDKRIQYNVLLGGRKIVSKKYHMASFEPKLKKAKKAKKVKAKNPPIPICLLPPVTIPDAFVPLHVDFTDFSRFDRDHPPVHPLQDDSAWYMERPAPTKIGLNIALRQQDRHTVLDAVQNVEQQEEMAAAEEAAAGAIVRKPPLGPSAQVNAVDKFLKTPLAVAAAMGNLELVKLLVEAGANVNGVDNFYWTPLHMAAHSGVRSVVEYLINHGASLEAKSLTGATPIMKAIETCSLDVVQLLINRGAKVRAEDMCSLTPLDIAACYADYHVYNTVNQKLQSMPAVKEKDKKPDKKKGAEPKRPGADIYQRKLGVPTGASGQPRRSSGSRPSARVSRASLSGLPPLPPLPRNPLHERPSLLQPGAAGASLSVDDQDVGDIAYRPMQVWTPQLTTDQLVELRAERRRHYGWLVDFEDFKMPFTQNVQNRLQQQAAVEEKQAEMKRKTAKRKK